MTRISTSERPAGQPPADAPKEDWTAFRFGVALQEDNAALSGREILQRFIDGAPPHLPICRVLTFRVMAVGAGYTGVETKGNLSRPIRPETGRVRCEARVVSRGRQIISCEAKLTGSDGKVLAHGTSTLFGMAAG